jgi:hypothetical protein
MTADQGSRARLAIRPGQVIVEIGRRDRHRPGLMADAVHRFVTVPGTLEVVTFGADHPGASASGARVFYERLGFIPAEAAPPGPDGGSRCLVNG